MGILTDISANTHVSETLLVSNGVDLLPLCEPRSNRYAVGFAVPTSSSVLITSDPDPAITSGFLVTPGGIVWITVKDHGALAMIEWYGRPDGTLYKVTVFEVSFPKE